ncbi:magnesium transporter MgtE N-terminal domain-containing protein [Microlunatus soli]|uniref:Mg/Co/Ni transporter MgtE (Contains CBS domain) n=1 Tax=Microlunatus soli TaxID=630515 RepID=A0A1H1Q6G1_9ACTN|nr:CBS domain-containing protein [Microlunatus soli]SDS18980.1 Mg/Co/Ni transporter MgtE (contains CBS domain) [Microlunatus soli]
MNGPSIFISRIRGCAIVDDAGDTIGKLRDVVISERTLSRPPRVKGLVVELFARHRIFVPMQRVRSIDAVQIVTSGVVNTRRFARRDSETLVVEDLFDQQVTQPSAPGPWVIFDVAMHQVRNDDWEVSEVAVREATRSRRFGRPFTRKGQVSIVEWSDIAAMLGSYGQAAEQLLAEMEDMKAADVARELHELTPQRRADVASGMDDEKLADALEELPEDEQVQLIQSLDVERAAAVLEEMDADDAADLIAELPAEMAELLLGEMEPDEAKDLRRLLTYEEFTAGGMMTPEPVIVPPDATVADALALVRQEELSPATAAMIFVCRPPLETPTGRLIGCVHTQRLLREPPSVLVSGLIDSDLEPLSDQSDLHAVSRYFATYNLVNAPVVDKAGRLIGAVTVDDVLDHVLPQDWRGDQLDAMSDSEEAN